MGLMLQHSDQIFIVLLEVHTLQIIVAEEKIPRR